MNIKRKERLETRDDLERIYNVYFDQVFRTAKMVLHNEEQAIDVVQETFIRAYQYRKSYDTNKCFHTWLMTILINECKRHLAKQNRVTYIEDYEKVKNVSYDWTEQWEDKTYLNHLLETLGEKIRLPIVLKYIQELKIEEIAEILGLNPNTVKSRLAFGREKLRKAYEVERRKDEV